MKIYNITDYGAVPCDALMTDAIQRAIDTCFIEGGGRVVVPRGIFLTGGLRIRSNVELYLESGAVLRGSRDPEEYFGWTRDTIEPVDEAPDTREGVGRSAYPYSRWNNAVIRALDAHDVKITGEPGSFIDGSNTYDALGEEKYRGPHAINFWNCRNVTFEGYTVVDSANWAHAIFNTPNVTARNIVVYGGHDGFDVRSCDNVLIEDCEFYTGDDCVAGFDNNDVIVRRCHLDCACSAFRFGGNNVLIEDCTSHAPSRYAFRGSMPMEERAANAPTKPTQRHGMHDIFLYYCDFRAVIRRQPGNIVIRNCTFEGADRLLSLEFDGKHIWCCNRSLRSVRFENCKITGLSKPIYIYGDENEPLIMELKDCSLGLRGDPEDTRIALCRNFERLTFDSVTFDERYGTPTAVLYTDGVVEGAQIVRE